MVTTTDMRSIGLSRAAGRQCRTGARTAALARPGWTRFCKYKTPRLETGVKLYFKKDNLNQINLILNFA